MLSPLNIYSLASNFQSYSKTSRATITFFLLLLSLSTLLLFFPFLFRRKCGLWRQKTLPFPLKWLLPKSSKFVLKSPAGYIFKPTFNKAFA